MFLFRFCQHLSPVFIQLENRPQSQCILNYVHEVKEFGTQQSFKTSKSNCTTLGTVIHLWCAKGECRTCLRFPSIFNDHWPIEFRNDFLPLLQPLYQEYGSLAEGTEINNSHDQLKLLPPIRQEVFTNIETQKIISTVSHLHPNNSIQIQRLHRASYALAVNKNIKLSSTKSRYSNCSKAIIENKLVEIIEFVNCLFKISFEETTSSHTQLLVKCSPYIEHTRKNWYGFPIQVWASTLEDDFNFFTPKQITDRVVYIKTTVNFGQTIGKDSVLVVSPLPLY